MKLKPIPPPTELSPPEVLDAEGALIGALLCNPGLVPEAARVLAPWDFHDAEFDRSPNARIFDALVTDAEAGRRSEPYSLAVRIGPSLAPVGGASYIGPLIASAPPSESVPELVKQIATVAARRRIGRAMSDPTLTAEGLTALLAEETRRTDDLAVKGQVIRASPFVWREPSAIPPRQWLYDRHFIRGFISATFSPGGVGKTMLALVEAVAMATGRPLLGVKPSQRLRVWVINLEDPKEELERRVAAICLHFGINPDELTGWLFLDSGREAEVVVARSTRNGVEICAPCVRQIEREIVARRIDALTIDPFVACHEVEENSNSAVNVVAKLWRGLADRTASGVELIHHTSKGPAPGETTVEHGRGASALLSAVRSARVLNTMTEQQATDWGVEERRLYFSVANGKANLAPPSSRGKWRRLAEVDLENGPVGFSDLVGVPEEWSPPDAMDGVTVADLCALQNKVAAGNFKASPQSAEWVGFAVAEVLGLSLDRPADKAKANRLQKAWLASGALRTEIRKDPATRKDKPYIGVGEWVSQ